jgi:hypothetical protein
VNSDPRIALGLEMIALRHQIAVLNCAGAETAGSCFGDIEHVDAARSAGKKAVRKKAAPRKASRTNSSASMPKKFYRGSTSM